MVTKISLTKDLSDLRAKAAKAFNEWEVEGKDDAREEFLELMKEINSIKARIKHFFTDSE